MRFFRKYFDESNSEFYLDVYIADKIGSFVRDAIIVVPGGAYGSICSDREGEPIAHAFMPYGYNAFVLHYSVGRKSNFPKQLIELSVAMKYIKDNAEEFNLNPKNIIVAGFSAGGHLAASLGILWHIPEIYDNVDMEYGYNKPKGVILGYPVISTDKEIAHMASFYNLGGTENLSNEQIKQYSLDLHIDDKTVPMFIMHTSNDEIVNVKNSLALAGALKDNSILFELHIFPDAPHGVALGNRITDINKEKYNNPHISEWVRIASEWADSLLRD